MDPSVQELIASLVEGARAAHPVVRCDEESFVRRVIDGASAGGGVDPAALLSLRAADLWLAMACAARDREALARFDVVFGNEFDIVLQRVRAKNVDRDDFIQVAREKLFVKDPPKIGEFSGQGDLRHWLRVTLTRTLLDMTKKRREELASDPDRGQAFDHPAPGADPEVDVMKAHYADAFRRAFERAAASLDVEDRNILRQHFAHGLGIDQLARIQGVHRATAARRIVRAREELLTRTRALLMRELALAPSDLDSLMRFVESRVHVTVERVLGPTIERA
ncbi:MAG: sigma-70 family RNA polymerase sigma factor [Polyangiaceae bacterium]|nr:sigma-70 family RNA polymerase sigma factor [Polyangiaceae bacterium]